MSPIPPQLVQALGERYRLERELGHGGMGAVYLAEDLKHHRKIAIKVLHPALAASVGPERFLREIEVAAHLQHPGILPLHDSGQAGDYLYYIMPYVEGESLRDRLARDSELPIQEAVKLLVDRGHSTASQLALDPISVCQSCLKPGEDVDQSKWSVGGRISIL